LYKTAKSYINQGLKEYDSKTNNHINHWFIYVIIS